MNREKIIAALEDYLDGNLSKAESSELEARLAKDASLADDLEMLRELRSTVAADEGEKRLKDKLKAAAKPYFAEEKKPAEKVFFPWRKFAIAASIMMAGLAGWYFWPLGEAQLSEKYLAPPADLGTSRSVVTPGETSLEHQVDSLYRLRQYHPALALMAQAEGAFTGQPSSDFYFQKGILFLFDKQPKEALAAFDKVQNGHLNDKKWFTAWAHYNSGDIAAAKAIFEESEVPKDQKHFIPLNAELSAQWPNINKKKTPLAEAEQWDGIADKLKFLER